MNEMSFSILSRHTDHMLLKSFLASDNDRLILYSIVTADDVKTWVVTDGSYEIGLLIPEPPGLAPKYIWRSIRTEG